MNRGAPSYMLIAAIASQGIADRCAAGAVSEHVIFGMGTQRHTSFTGRSFSADWLASFSSGSAWIGAHSASVADSSWKLLAIGGVKARPNGWSVGGSIEYGPAELTQGKTTFRVFRAQLSAPVLSKWHVRVQDAYISVAPASGHLVSSSAHLSLDGGLSMSLEAANSMGGNLDDRSIGFRMDYRAEPPYLMAGGTIAQSNNRLQHNLPSWVATTTRIKQGFVGLTFPIHSMEMTVAFEAASFADALRMAVSASVRVPISRSR